jgi:putative MATE family efflux protein
MVKLRNIRKMIDFKFYKLILVIAIPVMTQNFITSFAQVIDNLMVSSLGEQAIGAVGAANSIFFVVMLLMFGVSESIGIFIAQYVGAKEDDKQKQVFVIGFVSIMFVVTIATIIINTFSSQIIGFYTDDPVVQELCASYLQIATISYYFIAINVLIGAGFRSIGKPKYAMYCGVSAIFINTFLNYMFLNGILFFPQLGIEGLAIATVISRIVEFILLMFIMYKIHVPFFPTKKTFGQIKKSLIIQVYKKGIPLTINEFMWGLGMALLLGFYGANSTQDLVAVNIAYTIGNLFFVLMGGFAVAISVVVGQRLGAGKLYGAKYIAIKIYIFAVIVGFITTFVFILVAPLFTSIYNISQETADLAISIMRIMAIFFPVYIVTASFFFTLRSGGDTLSVLILDMGSMVLLTIPLAYYLANYTELSVVIRYGIIQCIDLIKFLLGAYLISKGNWIRKLT